MADQAPKEEETQQNEQGSQDVQEDRASTAADGVVAPEEEAEAQKTEEADPPEGTGDADGAGESETVATEAEPPADGEETTQEAGDGEGVTSGEAGEPSAEEGADGMTAGEAEAVGAEGEAPESVEAPPAGEEDGGEGEAALAATASEGEEPAEAAGEGEQPQRSSDDFADEGHPESPPRVSERLSREPSPTGEDQQRGRAADRIEEEDEEEATAHRLEPTSPDEVVATFDQIGLEDGGEGEEEEYEEEEVEEEEFNRDYMIASYKQAMQEREQKLHQNSLLQTKLSDYFRRKKADQGGQTEATQETEKSITDQEQRYAKFVFNLDELRRSRDSKHQDYDDRINELELECQSREEEVRLLFQGLLDAKKKVGLKSVSATNGRPFPSVTQRRSDGSGAKAQDPMSTSVDDMLEEEATLEDQVIRVRLDNIGLSNRVRKCETSLKAKEELSEGLHMIDFEQLKIENQTYNEKIEERQEELLKLKKKITNNVQVLTHLKEKLQYVQCKKQEQCEALNELDQTLSKRRDQLTRTKQIRDSLRNDNQRLKQNSGLLGNEALLRNFEENVDLVTDKRERLDKLKMDHSDMTLQCSKLKRKIDVARAQSAQ